MGRQSAPQQLETAGADIIIIPKALRAEWMDVMALDKHLSPMSFKIAGIIGFHFNRRSGETYVSQETIAKKAGVTARTVWAATADLEERGYILVERRELGVRASDGRRVCGGRGVANVYLPAFERSQLTATNAGRKLAIRCDLIWAERSQNAAAKVAVGCDPTLTASSSKKQNLPGTDFNSLGEIGQRLHDKIGPKLYGSWFRGVIFKGALEQEIVLRPLPRRKSREGSTTNL